MNEYVQKMKGKDIVLRVKLSTIGTGKPFSLLPLHNPIEKFPFTLKVGTTTFSTRFGWDMRKHFSNLSEDILSFGKSLSDKKEKGPRKLKFGPRDLVAALPQVTISIITT